MSYRIILDSCGDYTEEMKESGIFSFVPLELQVEDTVIVDDETFDQAHFLELVKNSPHCPKSACPSPERYKEAMEAEAERIYVVTLSDQLSGSFNSARLGLGLYMEEHENANVHVFNSCSASAGETLVALKIQELENAGKSYEEIIARVEAFIKEHKTYFVLETLDTLRKNGRLTGLKAVLAKALNIKPVMQGTREGSIEQLDQARGMEKALGKLLDYVMEEGRKSGRDVVAIAHCNCPARAKKAENRLKESGLFQKIVVMDTAGVSTLYANDGGIVISL